MQKPLIRIKINQLLPVALLLLTLNAVAQMPEDSKRIFALNKAIGSYLTDKNHALYYETNDSAGNSNKHSWLWPLCGLIQAANEMEVLQPQSHYMEPVMGAIEQYYSKKPPLPGYQDYVLKERGSSRFYDDNQWLAIAFLDAYKRTGQKHYLDKSETICRFMLGGLDTVAGGGFYWKEGDKATKNTCSNGPGILVLLQLYKITHKDSYLQTALAVYKWTNQYLQAESGIYYDNVKIPSLQIARATYTYNTGTMLQANVLLFQITADKKYLTEAQRIAGAARNHFFKNGRLPNGNYWFNAVMLRGFVDLYKIDANRSWIDFFETDANAIWNTERNSQDLLGAKPVKNLLDQAAMIEIYARLQQLRNAGLY